MKRKLIKIAIRLVLAAVALLALAGAALWLYLDHVVAAALTRGVQSATGCECTVERTNVGPLSGRMSLTSLVIRNPRGYRAGEMLRMDSIRLSVDPWTLRHQPVHVRHMEVDQPVVRIEAGAEGPNIRLFLARVEQSLGPLEARLKVDRLVVRCARLQIGSGLDGQPAAEIVLGSIEMKDLTGRDGQGVTPSELAGLLVTEMLQRAALEGRLNVAALLPPGVMKGLSSALGAMGGVAGQTGELLGAPLRTLLGALSRPSTTQAASDRQPAGGNGQVPKQ